MARHSVLCERTGDHGGSDNENQDGRKHSRPLRESVLANFPE